MSHDKLKYTNAIVQKLSDHSSLYSIAKFTYRTYCKLTGSLHVLPDFILIGTARGGTTSLFDNIMKHPDVFPPRFYKEVFFFDQNFQKGLDWYRVFFPFKWSKFNATKLHKQKFVTGEVHPRLIDHPYALNRIHKTIPNVKLIASLRNPVDRAYSLWQAYHYRGVIPLSFEDAIKEEEKRVSQEWKKMEKDESYYSYDYYRYALLSQGIYANALERWLKLFPRDQFLILKSEDSFINPQKTLDELFEFLGLPKHKIEYKKNPKDNFPHHTMETSTRKKLMEYFKPHNERLYKLIGKNFDWENDELSK